MNDSKICTRCLREDQEIKAESWCGDCEEFVCKTCAKHHKGFSPTHKIAPIVELSYLSTYRLQLSRYCDTHPEEKIVLFCCQHDQVMCTSCFTNFHQNCKAVMSLEKAAENVRDGTALDDLERRLESLMIATDEILNNKRKNSTDFDEQRELIKRKIIEVRNSINFHLDKIEAELDKDLERKYDERKEIFRKEYDMLSKSQDEVTSWKNDLEALKNHTSDIQLFHAIKVIDSKVHKNEVLVHDIQQELKLLEISFKPSDEAVNIQTALQSLGEVICNEREITHSSEQTKVQQSQAHVPTALTHTKFTRVNSFETSKLGENVEVYRGCFITNNRLLLSDFYQNHLYACNTDGSQVRTINLSSQPSSLTLVNENVVVVTLRGKGIQIIDLITDTAGRQIEVGKNCQAISSLNGSIWVRSDENKLSLIDINGRNLKDISLYCDPWDICLDSKGNIYFTTSSDDDVHCITPNGKESTFYTSSALCESRAITVDKNGNLYVAGRDSSNIHKISNNGRHSEFILTRQDGIRSPTGLSYNMETNELLVVNFIPASIMIYKSF